MFEKEWTGSVTEHRHHIIVNGRAIAIVTRPSTGSVTTEYLLRDHQDNVSEVYSDSGSNLQSLSFDAFGKRRNADWTADTADNRFGDSFETRRGYTGHEHLDNVRLVHMNGRTQDPIIGRMISADPFVPDAANGQSNNRYSYVHNSPLTFTDPSGFIPSHSVAGHLGYGGFHGFGGFGGFGGIQVIPEIPIATPADGIAQQIGIEEVARGRIGSLVGLSRTGWFGSFTPMGRFHMMGSNLADEFSVETPIDAHDMNVRSDGLDDTSSRTDVDIASVMPSEMEHCRCFQEYLFCSIA